MNGPEDVSEKSTSAPSEESASVSSVPPTPSVTPSVELSVTPSAKPEKNGTSASASTENGSAKKSSVEDKRKIEGGIPVGGGSTRGSRRFRRNSTIFTDGGEGTTLIPHICPHCFTYTNEPPNFIRTLVAMSPGKGHKAPEENFFSATKLARVIGVSRERGRQLMSQAMLNKLVESPWSGSGIYKKSKLGHLVLTSWKRAGWLPDSPKIEKQEKLRAMLLRNRDPKDKYKPYG